MCTQRGHDGLSLFPVASPSAELVRIKGDASPKLLGLYAEGERAPLKSLVNIVTSFLGVFTPRSISSAVLSSTWSTGHERDWLPLQRARVPSAALRPGPGKGAGQHPVTHPLRAPCQRSVGRDATVAAAGKARQIRRWRGAGAARHSRCSSSCRSMAWHRLASKARSSEAN